MLLAVGSVKGSPGVTTLAVALALVWPGDQAVVVEADCAGGDIGARGWLADTPGLTSLATQARSASGLRSAAAARRQAIPTAGEMSRRIGGEQAGGLPGQVAGEVGGQVGGAAPGRGAPAVVSLQGHVSRLPCGADVVVAPAGRQPATVAAGLLAEADPGVWVGQRPVILDVGRLDPGASNAALVQAATTLLVVSSGEEAALLRLAEAVLPPVPVVVVVNGPCAYSPSEITASVGFPVIAMLPWDGRAAAVLWGRQPPGASWTRRGLPAAVRAVAQHLAPAPNATSVPPPTSASASGSRVSAEGRGGRRALRGARPVPAVPDGPVADHRHAHPAHPAAEPPGLRSPDVQPSVTQPSVTHPTDVRASATGSSVNGVWRRPVGGS